MKVALVNSLYHPYRVGGAEYSVQLLAEALVAAGHEVSVVTTEPGRDLRIEDVNGVLVHYVGLRNLYWPFQKSGHADLGPRLDRARKSLWHAVDMRNPVMGMHVGQVLALREPDVVHTNNLAGLSVAAWEAARRAHLPIVHTIRDYYALCPASTMFRDGQNCEEICRRCEAFSSPKRHVSQRVDTVVGISRYVLDVHLAAGFFAHAAERAVVVNPVHPGSPTNMAGADEPIRFGFLGRLEPEKGIELLLQAFAGIPEGRARLVVAGVGDSQYVYDLQERYARPDVEFCGFVPSGEVYSRVDCVVVPAVWREPLNRTVLEGFAHRLPAVGTRVGGLVENIEHERTGLLVPPDDSGALRAALLRLADDRALLHRLAAAAGDRATALTPDRHAEVYLGLYERARRRVEAAPLATT